MPKVQMFIPEERMRLMQTIASASSTHKCPECSGPAYCAMEDGKSPNLCWCMELPTKTSNPVTDADTCLCRTCLTKTNL